MAEEQFDFAMAEPHVVRKTPAETGGDLARFESTLYPASDQAASATELSHERWSLDYEFDHVHPNQEERWEVVAGKLRVVVDGDERILTPGEEISLPSNVPHRHGNPTDSPARVIWERRPGFSDVEWAESLYTLAQRGQVKDEGVPGLLQLAVITDAYPDESVYAASLPVSIQSVVFSLLARLGRLRGYEATHTRENE